MLNFVDANDELSPAVSTVEEPAHERDALVKDLRDWVSIVRFIVKRCRLRPPKDLKQRVACAAQRAVRADAVEAVATATGGAGGRYLVAPSSPIPAHMHRRRCDSGGHHQSTRAAAAAVGPPVGVGVGGAAGGVEGKAKRKGSGSIVGAGAHEGPRVPKVRRVLLATEGSHWGTELVAKRRRAAAQREGRRRDEARPRAGG